MDDSSTTVAAIKLWWHPGKRQHLVAEKGGAGYIEVREVGKVWVSKGRGRVPLLDGGKTVGYISKGPREGLMPVTRWKCAVRNDNVVTCDDETRRLLREQARYGAEYKPSVRVIGYIAPPTLANYTSIRPVPATLAHSPRKSTHAFHPPFLKTHQADAARCLWSKTSFEKFIETFHAGMADMKEFEPTVAAGRGLTVARKFSCTLRKLMTTLDHQSTAEAVRKLASRHYRYGVSLEAWTGMKAPVVKALLESGMPQEDVKTVDGVWCFIIAHAQIEYSREVLRATKESSGKKQRDKSLAARHVIDTPLKALAEDVLIVPHLDNVVVRRVVCWRFNGSSENFIGTVKQLKLSESFTIIIWVKPCYERLSTKPLEEMGILGCGDVDAEGQLILSLRARRARLVFNGEVLEGPEVPEGEWSLLKVMYDSAKGEAVLQQTVATVGPNLTPAGNSLYLGSATTLPPHDASKRGAKAFFEGYLDGLNIIPKIVSSDWLKAASALLPSDQLVPLRTKPKPRRRPMPPLETTPYTTSAFHRTVPGKHKPRGRALPPAPPQHKKEQRIFQRVSLEDTRRIVGRVTEENDQFVAKEDVVHCTAVCLCMVAECLPDVQPYWDGVGRIGEGFGGGQSVPGLKALQEEGNRARLCELREHVAKISAVCGTALHVVGHSTPDYDTPPDPFPPSWMLVTYVATSPDTVPIVWVVTRHSQPPDYVLYEAADLITTETETHPTIMSLAEHITQSIITALQEHLQTLPSPDIAKIYFTGHGVDGGVAEILQRVAAEQFPNQVNLITFGSPIVEASRLQVGKVSRYVNKNDIVPRCFEEGVLRHAEMLARLGLQSIALTDHASRKILTEKFKGRPDESVLYIGGDGVQEVERKDMPEFKILNVKAGGADHGISKYLRGLFSGYGYDQRFLRFGKRKGGVWLGQTPQSLHMLVEKDGVLREGVLDAVAKCFTPQNTLAVQQAIAGVTGTPVPEHALLEYFPSGVAWMDGMASFVTNNPDVTVRAMQRAGYEIKILKRQFTVYKTKDSRLPAEDLVREMVSALPSTPLVDRQTVALTSKGEDFCNKAFAEHGKGRVITIRSMQKWAQHVTGCNVNTRHLLYPLKIYSVTPRVTLNRNLTQEGFRDVFKWMLFSFGEGVVCPGLLRLSDPPTGNGVVAKLEPPLGYAEHTDMQSDARQTAKAHKRLASKLLKIYEQEVDLTAIWHTKMHNSYTEGKLKRRTECRRALHHLKTELKKGQMERKAAMKKISLPPDFYLEMTGASKHILNLTSGKYALRNMPLTLPALMSDALLK